MKKEEVTTDRENSAADDARSRAAHKPDQGAESQLHNYNVLLTRLGDVFGDDENLEPDRSKK